MLLIHFTFLVKKIQFLRDGEMSSGNTYMYIGKKR